MPIITKVYAKPGELIQGVLTDNTRFLLSNKSSQILYTTTLLTNTQTNHHVYLKPKACKAVDIFHSTLPQNRCNPDIKLFIQQSSNIPEGKGLSSSSTDVLGILSVLNRFYETAYTPELLYTLAVQVDPTDPCLHEENVLFNSSKGMVVRLEKHLPYQMLYFDADFDSTIDTISFGREQYYSPSDHQVFDSLVHKVTAAFACQDYNAFYECLRISAQINNSILPKPGFQLLDEFAQIHQCGIFVAHSGTYMGLVMEPEKFEQIYEKAIPWIKKQWNTPIYSE